jgi:hypothetical protein
MARPPKTPPPSADGRPSPEAIVAREEPQRRIAAYTALASGFLTIVAVVIEQLISGKLPSTKVATDFVEALSAQSGGPATKTSYAVGYANFKLDHEAVSVLVAVLHGAAFLLLIPIVVLLLRGARERGGTLGKFMEPVAIVGLTVAGVCTIAIGVMEVSEFRSVADHLTPGAIKDAITGTGRATVTNVLSIGTLLITLPVCLGSLQGMRIGLLTRGTGIVGTVVGLLFLFQVAGGPLVIALYFSYLAFVVRGYSGLPEAWATGVKVEPEPRQPPEPRAKRAKNASLSK